MALNRFYQPGQSQYMSQYVPHKLPFELWQGQLAQKDAQIDAGFAQAETYKPEVTGLTELNLPESQRKYYQGTDAEIEQMFKSQTVSDYENSLKSANAINSKVDELISDPDFIFKMATGDIANIFMDINKEYNQHLAQNEIYTKRMEWYKEADKIISSKGADIINSPWLLSGYKDELRRMSDPTHPEYNPNYVPNSLPVIGESIDRSKELQSQVNVLNASGSTKVDLSDPIYEKWSSWKGVTAGRYEQLALSILGESSNSKVRRDIEAQVDAQISSGDLDPAMRQTAIDAEIFNLVENSKKLAYGVSDEGASGKSQTTMDAEKVDPVIVLDDAESNIVNGISTSLNNLEGAMNSVTQKKQAYEDKIKTMIPGGMPKDFAYMSQEELKLLSTTTRIPLDQLVQAQREYSELVIADANLQIAYKINDFNVRDTSGFNSSQESTYNLLEVFRHSPHLLKQAIADPNSPLRNTPQWKEYETIKEKNPALYKELTDIANGEGNVFDLYTTDDFKTSSGQFDSESAYNFLENLGVDDIDKYRVVNQKTGNLSNNLTESEFNRILRSNQTKDGALTKTVNTVYGQKDKYEDLKTTNVKISDDKIITSPGIIFTADPNLLQNMKYATDVYGSKLITGSGENESVEVKKALVNTITGSKTPLNMVMTAEGNFIYEGQAIGELLTDVGSKEVFLNNLSKELFNGKVLSDLNPDQMKELNTQYENIMKDVGSYQLTLNTSKSTSLGNYVTSGIDNKVSSMDRNDVNYESTVVTGNIISNKSSLEKAEQQNQGVIMASYSDSLNGFVQQTVDTNIPFVVKVYEDGNVIPINFTMTSITPAIQKSDYSTIEQSNTNSNGTTTYQNQDTRTDITGGTTGFDRPQTDINGNPIMIYTFVHTKTGEIRTETATSPSKAFETLSLNLNGL
jgi:hypothetical protein